LLARDTEEIKTLVNLVEEESRDLGLQLNKSKTKIMVIDRQHNNRPELRRIDHSEVADQHVYLGSLITNNGTTELEIQKRCEMSKIATKKLTKIWRDNSISKQLKVRLVQCLVFPILMYGCEAWTLRQK
jgi:hypothetical protein